MMDGLPIHVQLQILEYTDDLSMYREQLLSNIINNPDVIKNTKYHTILIESNKPILSNKYAQIFKRIENNKHIKNIVVRYADLLQNEPIGITDEYIEQQYGTHILNNNIDNFDFNDSDEYDDEDIISDYTNEFKFDQISFDHTFEYKPDSEINNSSIPMIERLTDNVDFNYPDNIEYERLIIENLDLSNKLEFENEPLIIENLDLPNELEIEKLRSERLERMVDCLRHERIANNVQYDAIEYEPLIIENLDSPNELEFENEPLIIENLDLPNELEIEKLRSERLEMMMNCLQRERMANNVQYNATEYDAPIKNKNDEIYDFLLNHDVQPNYTSINQLNMNLLSLNSLVLQDCMINYECIKLLTNLNCLTNLDLMGNALTGFHVDSLLKELIENNKIENLNLAYNKLYLCDFIDGLHSNTSLKNLGLSNNYFNGDICKKLSTIKHNVCIYLNGNIIVDVGYEQLIDSLKFNKINVKFDEHIYIEFTTIQNMKKVLCQIKNNNVCLDEFNKIKRIKINLFKTLSNYLVLEIIKYMDVENVIKFSDTCVVINDICSDPHYWRQVTDYRPLPSVSLRVDDIMVAFNEPLQIRKQLAEHIGLYQYINYKNINCISRSLVQNKIFKILSIHGDERLFDFENKNDIIYSCDYDIVSGPTKLCGINTGDDTNSIEHCDINSIKHCDINVPSNDFRDVCYKVPIKYDILFNSLIYTNIIELNLTNIDLTETLKNNIPKYKYQLNVFIDSFEKSNKLLISLNILLKYKKIHKLTLSNCKLDNKNIVVIPNLRFVSILDLSKNKYLSNIKNIIKTNNINELNLENNYMCNRQFKKLSELIIKNTSLKKINIVNNNVDIVVIKNLLKNTQLFVTFSVQKFDSPLINNYFKQYVNRINME
jgi:hypothetical protein